jgi:hypothetical protein
VQIRVTNHTVYRYTNPSVCAWDAAEDARLEASKCRRPLCFFSIVLASHSFSCTETNCGPYAFDTRLNPIPNLLFCDSKNFNTRARLSLLEMNPASPISPSRRGSSFLDPGSKQTNLDLQPYDPNDGYDYNNVGDPPEGSDTKFEVVLTVPEQQDKSLPSLAPKVGLLELPGTNKVKVPGSPAAQDLEATSQELEEHVPGLGGPKYRIGRRPLVQWRAKIPSDLEQGNGVPAQEHVENGQFSGNHANVPPDATGSGYKPRKRTTIRRKSDANPQKRKDDEHLRVETHEIKLHWKKIPTDEETKFELNITSVPSDGVAEDHLKWQWVLIRCFIESSSLLLYSHREDFIMNLNKLKVCCNLIKVV